MDFGASSFAVRSHLGMSSPIDYVRDHLEVISGALLLGGGLVGLGAFALARRRARASLGWPSVVGEVVASRPSRLASGGTSDGVGGASDARHTLVVENRYAVDGRTYTSTVYGHGSDPAGTHAEVAADAARRFPRGARVQVFYDPASPSEAVLEPGRDDGTLLGAAISTAAAAYGAWTLWQALTGGG